MFGVCVCVCVGGLDGKIKKGCFDFYDSLTKLKYFW
jgi:hypothetical protein